MAEQSYAVVLSMGERELTPVAVFLGTPDQVQIRAALRCELAKRYALSEQEIDRVLMLELMARRYRLGFRHEPRAGYYALAPVVLLHTA